MLRIAGVIDLSTIDYLGKLCAVIFFCGCPFRCGWCQNRDVVLGKGCKLVEEEKLVEELRGNFLIDGVCLGGGEPLMQDLLPFLKELKQRTRLLAKLDTNGYFHERLEECLPLLDFVSIDVKAPLDERYGKLTGRDDWEGVVDAILRSLELLNRWGGEKEARTTIVPGLLGKEEVEEVARVVREFGFQHYTIQQFVPHSTLDQSFEQLKSPSHGFLFELAKVAKRVLGEEVRVRIFSREGGFEIIG